MPTTFNQRAAAIGPRVQVVKGFDPMETQAAQTIAPVASGVTVYSGQFLKLTTAGEFDLANTGFTGELFVALQDSADLDVVASGKLTGLPVSGQFEIETPWFDKAATWTNAIGARISIGATAGTATLTSAVAGASGTATPVCGVVTSDIRDVIGENSTALPITTGGVFQGKVPVLRFRTVWQPDVKKP